MLQVARTLRPHNPYMNVYRDCVYLVGAGPGDPELLTLKAARVLSAADVVVYDHLVSDGVLAYISTQAKRIYVGKESGNHTLSQEELSRLLVDLGRKGGIVVRLKGGDPYIFGRGGEEIAALAEHGLRFEVVPGITAASGMAAYAGIPLTHRDLAQSCVFVTGHLKDGSVDLDWACLARPRQTVVIYMGVGGLETICQQLIAHGLPGTTPAAVIRNATLPAQQIIQAQVATITEACRSADIKPPALIVIGGVAALSHQLDWFSTTRTTPPTALKLVRAENS